MNSLYTDALPEFFDFQNSQPDGSNSFSVVAPSEELGKPSEWQDWADDLITDSDPLASDWNEILADASTDPEVWTIPLCTKMISFITFSFPP